MLRGTGGELFAERGFLGVEEIGGVLEVVLGGHEELG